VCKATAIRSRKDHIREAARGTSLFAIDGVMHAPGAGAHRAPMNPDGWYILREFYNSIDDEHPYCKELRDAIQTFDIYILSEKNCYVDEAYDDIVRYFDDIVNHRTKQGDWTTKLQQGHFSIIDIARGYIKQDDIKKTLIDLTGLFHIEYI